LTPPKQSQSKGVLHLFLSLSINIYTSINIESKAMIISNRALTKIQSQASLHHKYKAQNKCLSTLLSCNNSITNPSRKWNTCDSSFNDTTSLQSRNIVGISHALDKRIYKWAKSVMPPISKTEQIALASGTIGFDRDIFTGSPSLEHLIKTYQPKTSPEEQAFIDEKVSHLCTLLNDHDVSMRKDFSKEAWDYMRNERFFGMKIPKEWGGLGFSTHAVSQVLAKLATHCFDANATVAVPNSLGPGELLVRYGTPEQKKYFLPRLADGTLIPCFGLTGPHSGSDATSLIGSDCIVEMRDGELGVRASFKKRYITLAPIAGVVGLGLNLRDPNGLLSGKGSEGFTVALLE
jgi:hypothetical protein